LQANAGPVVSLASRLSIAGVLTLALWLILWETLLAPVSPHSFWLAFKALPLLLLWRGVARGARMARQWTLLLLPWYAAEGLVRALTESGRHAAVAAIAASLAVASFVALLMWFRAERARPISRER
jgi:uncharacterized membrane protein